MVEHTPATVAAEIVTLINSRVASPRQDELVAIIGKLAPKTSQAVFLPEAVVAYRAIAQEYEHHTNAVLGPLDANAPDDHPIHVQNEALSTRVDTATDVLLRHPPVTWGDMVGYASIVAHEAGHGLATIHEAEVDEDDRDPGPVAAEKLALAILRAGTAPAGFPQPQPAVLSPEHVAYRALLVEIDRVSRIEDSDECQAALDPLLEQELALSRQIWSVPAVTDADVLLRGEIAEYHENGILEEADSPDAYFDERALAQLIRAVVTVGRSRRHGK